MSEEKDLSNVPEDVKELNKSLGQFGDYHRLIMEGNFPGKASKVVAELLLHIKDVYDQMMEQYTAHPWVKEQMEKKAEADKDEA